jgi:hypothetical protein
MPQDGGSYFFDTEMYHTIRQAFNCHIYLLDFIFVRYVTDMGTCTTVNDNACSVGSRVVWNSVYGRTYYIFITGFADFVGSFSLAIFSG